MSTSKIVLVDLRTPGATLPAVLSDGVVVVDHADALPDNAETYLSLLAEKMVTAVVCVAVGEAGTDNPFDGVVLDLPPALRHAAVLWVGDPQGVDWAPERSAPRQVEDRVDSLDSLIAALRVPVLFDQVVAAAENLPSAAVNPGIRLVSSAADPVELAEARAAAVRSLCAAEHSTPHDLSASMGRTYLPTSRDGAVLSGQVRTSRTEAVRRLDHVAELARTLGTAKALLHSPRSTERLGSQVVWAGQAAEHYRRAVAELLTRMDGQLQVGRPSIEDVVALGAPPPRESDGAEIAADLRQAVEARLDEGAALSPLAQDLHLVAVNSGPQGCTTALDEVRRRGPLSLEMPSFRSWPLRMMALPLIFLTCALMALLCGPGWIGWLAGGLLAVAWFASGWLLLARRPGPEAENGLEAALVPAAMRYGITGALGAAVGAVVGGLPAVRLAQWLADVPRWAVLGSAVLMVVVWASTAVLNWRSAVRAWRAELKVEQLRAVIADLNRIAEEVTAREWLPMRRRRTLSAAAAEVAAGLGEIAATLEGSGDGLFAAPEPSSGDHTRMMRPVPQELYAVVRGDLVDVCRDALGLAWPAAAADLTTPPGVYAQRLERLLDEYGADVRRAGLMTSMRSSGHQGPRDALMARVWAESPAALAALRTNPDDAMTQMCGSGQLGYLSTGARSSLVRFAPARLRQVLERDGAHDALVADPGVTWSDGGEYFGAVRLLPLRPESVRHVSGGVR